MKIAIDKNELVKALDTVLKAVPVGKVTVQILEGVLLEADNGKLHLTCNNLESAIKYTLDCEVINPGSAVVNSKLFNEIIKKMPDEELDILTSDKEMSIEAGKTVMKLLIMKAEYPEMPMSGFEKARFEIEQRIFSEMINGVAFAIYDGEEKPALTGIKIDIENNIMNIVAIDGFMMAWKKSLVSAPDASILLNGKPLENISKALDSEGNVQVIMGDNIALLSADNIQLSVRVIDGSFMNYKRFVPPEYSTSVRIVTRDLSRSLERSVLVLETGAKGSVDIPLKLTSKADGLKLALGSGKGSFDEEVSGDIAGKDIEIGLDPRRLITCLRHIGDKEIMLNFTAKEAPVFITPVEGDQFIYMVLPVRFK